MKVGKPTAFQALFTAVLVAAALLTWWQTSLPAAGKMDLLPAVQVMSLMHVHFIVACHHEKLPVPQLVLDILAGCRSCAGWQRAQ